MGERGHRSTLASLLAEALYLQGRLDEAQQMTEEAETLSPSDDIDAQARWRAARAKLLARHRQFPAARQLIAEAQALISPTSWMSLKAYLLMAEAEVNQLAGDPDRAAASLHAALRIMGTTTDAFRRARQSRPRQPYRHQLTPPAAAHRPGKCEGLFPRSREPINRLGRATEDHADSQVVDHIGGSARVLADLPVTQHFPARRGRCYVTGLTVRQLPSGPRTIGRRSRNKRTRSSTAATDGVPAHERTGRQPGPGGARDR